MCGIAGIISFQEPLETRFIRSMSQILQHRGPDDEGYLAVDGRNEVHIDTFPEKAFLLFAHRRLSIIDLSHAGHQPMPNHDKQTWIIFNGEIYNYRKLKKELESCG